MDFPKRKASMAPSNIGKLVAVVGQCVASYLTFDAVNESRAGDYSDRSGFEGQSKATSSSFYATPYFPPNQLKF